ncbi:MAG: ATP phosphoribosyltransferase regulatory subunit [Sedimentitalea sp.]
MTDRAATLALAAQLRARFEGAGAKAIETAVLQPAETLLDLYGEDIRARAYVTSDALRGEQMLRPDFTVPVVQMHMADGADPARYTYAGEVFRRQKHDPERANEYVQVGYEVFDRVAPAEADAEVFALMVAATAHLDLRAVTGDIGILMAAVQGLDTSDARKAALMRHIWRPERFRALLERFAGRQPMSKTRTALLNTDDAPELGVLVGKRGAGEIIARVEALRLDSTQAPLSGAELNALEQLLEVEGAMPDALEALQRLRADLPAIAPALERLKQRMAALSARGIDVARLAFQASYGRSSMEYYDGFVFGLSVPERADLPLVASGGRYDALTRQLGRGREIPAVGGVLRPGLMLDLEAGA